MKELNELSAWTDSIISEFVKPNTAKKQSPIELKRDIKTQAQHKYPSYEPDDALSLFIADKLEDMEKANYEQNKTINAQGKMLNQKISALDRSVSNVDSSNNQAQTELEKIKSLATQKQDDVKSTMVSRKEAEELLNQLNDIKKNPSIDRNEYAEMKRQVDIAIKNGTSPKEILKIKDQLSKMAADNDVSNRDITDFENKIKDLSDFRNVASERVNLLIAKQEQLEKEKQELTDRIQRGEEHDQIQDDWLKHIRAASSIDVNKFDNVAKKYTKSFLESSQQIKEDIVPQHNELDEYIKFFSNQYQTSPTLQDFRRKISAYGSEGGEMIVRIILELSKKYSFTQLRTKQFQQQILKFALYDLGVQSRTRHLDPDSDPDIMGESLLNNNQRENKNFSNRLTSIDKEIHSLAENILGPQYAKYLK